MKTILMTFILLSIAVIGFFAGALYQMTIQAKSLKHVPIVMDIKLKVSGDTVHPIITIEKQ